MNLIEATKERVLELEAVVDRVLDLAELPSTDRSTCYWCLLTVAEDQQRLLARQAFHDPERFLATAIGFSNRVKFQLKHALAAVLRRTADVSGPIPTRLEDAQYVTGVELLKVMEQYNAAVAAFSSFAAGSATAKTEPHAPLLHFFPKPGADKYQALDYLESLLEPFSTAYGLMMNWIWGGLVAPAVVKEIALRARGDGDLVVYDYDAELASALSSELGPAEGMIPTDWHCAYGTAAEIQSVIRALRTVAAYHAISVNMGAERLQLTGIGLNSLILSLTEDELIHRVQALTTVHHEIVDKLIRLLVFGAKTNNPDPALQPLVPAGVARLLLAPSFFLSSHAERNLLVLLARVDSREFDKTSHTFEARMVKQIDDLIRSLSRPYWKLRTLFTIPGAREVGDVDLLLADAHSRTVVVGELKWTLPPGDPREWILRDAEARRKTNQVMRKHEAVMRRMPQLLEALGLDAAKHRDWRATPVVVIEGFTAESQDDVAVVTRDVFLRGLSASTSLKQATKWLVSREWLPHRNHDFFRRAGHTTLNGVELIWPFVEINLRRYAAAAAGRG